MRRIEEYKRLEDDRLQNKGKAPLLGRSRQGIISARPKKDFRMQESKRKLKELMWRSKSRCTKF